MSDRQSRRPATRSCVLPVGAVTEEQKVVTIAGFGAGKPRPVQEAWAELDVAQCGYCQVGMIMAASVLLARTPRSSDDGIRAEITNICRCGTYGRVLAGVKRAAERMTANRRLSKQSLGRSTAAGATGRLTLLPHFRRRPPSGAP